MTSFTPRPPSGNVSVFLALFIFFMIFLTPVVPAASAMTRAAGRARSNSAKTDLRPGASLNQPPPAVISATKTDSFPDPNSDGKAEPGDTITYDVNVSNSG